jgi:phosphatidylcholine synthase
MYPMKTTAWLVHLYTASGGIIGMLALFAAASGEIRTAFLLLFITVLIDSTDGLLARRVRVSEVLPQFSGAMVDNVVDFLTYIWIPVFIMWTTGLLPHVIWIAIPILAGLYAYGQVDMKTPDNFFLGFPSYWNVVALYFYLLRPEPFWAVAMLLIPGVLTFIPTRYLYPSKNRVLAAPTWVGGVIWAFTLLYLLVQEQPNVTLALVSLAYPIYYVFASFYIDWRIRSGKLELTSTR